MILEKYPVEQTSQGTFIAEAKINGVKILAYGDTEKDALINREFDILEKMKSMRSEHYGAISKIHSV